MSSGNQGLGSVVNNLGAPTDVVASQEVFWLNKALVQAKSVLAKTALSPKVSSYLETAFGQGYDAAVADSILSQWKGKDFSQLPTILVLSPTAMNGAQGAYSAANNTIYLSSALLVKGSVTAARNVLLEEFGHYLDAQVNAQDAAGDEGEIWRNLVLNRRMSAAQLETLRAENDFGTVTVNGQAVIVEQNLPAIFIATSVNAVEGTTSGVFTLTRALGLDTALTVNYTLSGSAIQGTDYSTLSGTATFAAGSQIATVNINPIDDRLFESRETVTITLTAGTGYTLGSTSTATLNFDDNELPISSGTSGNISPQISGNNVVWVSFDVSSGGIFLYNGISTNKLPSSFPSSFSPLISGNNIVWSTFFSGDNEIYLYNGTNTITLTNNTSDDNSPQISGNNVVWRSFTTTNINSSEIFLYNGINTTRLTNNGFPDAFPKISGNNVIWQGFSGNSDEIYFYNGTSTIQLTNNSFTDDSPKISGNNVVWRGFTNNSISSGEIYLYDIAGNFTFQLTSNTTSDFSPEVSGGSVVWVGFDGTDNEIFLYRNGGIFQLTNNNTDDNSPQISGNNVVWRGTGGNDGGTDSEIFFYNGSTITQVTENAYTDSVPQISGDKIVWQGQNGTGTNSEIYLADFTPTTPSITLAVSPASVTEDGTNNLVYTFTRSGSTTSSLTVNYGITGTANATDYTGATPGTGKTITFAAGSSTATLTIDPTADTTVENNETIALTLATGAGYTIGTTTGVTGTITNDDTTTTNPTITLAVSPACVTEDGTTNLVYTFTRTGDTANALTVTYSIAGTATATDYTGATPGTGKTIIFAAGSSTATLTIDPTADTTVENNETVRLTLASGTNYTVGTTTAVTGTITNDDTPTITLDVSPSSVTEDGTSNLVYTFTRTGSTTSSLTVNYGIAGTADATDYIGATPGTGKTITFAAGSTTATLTIDPTADTTIESNETVILTLATGTGYTVGTTTAVTGTINDDDSIAPPSVTLIGDDDDDYLMGGTGNDTLQGLGGNDVLNGGPGADTMEGGDGSDAYYVDNSGDVVTDVVDSNPGEIDTVYTSITYTLPNTLENLVMLNTGNANDNINATGNSINNKLTGNSGTNILSGLAGNDVLNGKSGDDILNGGAGRDTLTGGIGTETFVFQFGQSLVTAPDRITDFAIGTDKIDLLTQAGAATAAPTAFSRAADSNLATLANVVNQVFTDANGLTAGAQALGVNSAALVSVTTAGIAGTYLVINDGTAGFQSANDLVVNITGFSGTLPGLGAIPPSSFFI
ncbi:MAG: beta strand repeat-containing protein [Synechocystis sp.]